MLSKDVGEQPTATPPFALKAAARSGTVASQVRAENFPGDAFALRAVARRTLQRLASAERRCPLEGIRRIPS